MRAQESRRRRRPPPDNGGFVLNSFNCSKPRAVGNRPGFVRNRRFPNKLLVRRKELTLRNCCDAGDFLALDSKIGEAKTETVVVDLAWGAPQHFRNRSTLRRALAVPVVRKSACPGPVPEFVNPQYRHTDRKRGERGRKTGSALSWWLSAQVSMRMGWKADQAERQRYIACLPVDGMELPCL